ASGSLTFNAGVTSQTVTVLVNGDAVYEGNETFTLNLSNPSGVGLGRAQATGTVVDDDPAPTISVGDASAVEGDSGLTPVTFTVTLSAPVGLPVSLVWNTGTGGTASPDKDYYSVYNRSLSFAAGETSKTITVNVIPDAYRETNETFQVVLSGAA